MARRPENSPDTQNTGAISFRDQLQHHSKQGLEVPSLERTRHQWSAITPPRPEGYGKLVKIVGEVVTVLCCRSWVCRIRI